MVDADSSALVCRRRPTEHCAWHRPLERALLGDATDAVAGAGDDAADQRQRECRCHADRRKASCREQQAGGDGGTGVDAPQDERRERRADKCAGCERSDEQPNARRSGAALVAQDDGGRHLDRAAHPREHPGAADASQRRVAADRSHAGQQAVHAPTSSPAAAASGRARQPDDECGTHQRRDAVEQEDQFRASYRRAGSSDDRASEEAERAPARERRIGAVQAVSGNERRQRCPRRRAERRLAQRCQPDQRDERRQRQRQHEGGGDRGGAELGADHHAPAIPTVGEPAREGCGGDVAELAGQQDGANPGARAGALPDQYRQRHCGRLAAGHGQAAAGGETAHRGAPAGHGVGHGWRSRRRGDQRVATGCGRVEPATGCGRVEPATGCGRDEPATGCGCLRPATGCGCLRPAWGASTSHGMPATIGGIFLPATGPRA